MLSPSLVGQRSVAPDSPIDLLVRSDNSRSHVHSPEGFLSRSGVQGSKMDCR